MLSLVSLSTRSEGERTLQLASLRGGGMNEELNWEVVAEGTGGREESEESLLC